MERTASATYGRAAVWILAILVIALWLSLKPDWEFMRVISWLWPFTEFIHVLSLVGFFGLRTMIDLRLTSRALRRVPIRSLVQKYLPATVILAAVTIASGMALYAATPEAMSARPMFQLKVAVLSVALLNLAFLHAFALPAVERLERKGVIPLSAQISALLSMSLWAVVIVAALLIPYIG